MTSTQQLILPLLVLVAWSSVVWLWMYITRLPAIRAARIKPDPMAPAGVQMSQLPAKVRWKADNYNHLMEQPTIFYALVLALAVMGVHDPLNSTLAWAYVLLRIVHSLVQSLGNKIEIRFVVFSLSNIPLIWLIVNAFLSLS